MTVWRDGQFRVALAAGPLFWLVLWIITSPSPDLRWPAHRPGIFLLLALVYPALEEIVFRAGLQGAILRPRLVGCYKGVTTANVVTSAVFCVFHFFNHPPLWAALVFFPSLIFGYFYDRYASIRPAIILHSFYNAGFIWLFTTHS